MELKELTSPLRIDKKNVFRFLVKDANDRNPFAEDFCDRARRVRV